MSNAEVIEIFEDKPKVFTVPCHVAQIKSRADRTFALTMNTTKELEPEEGAILLSLLKSDGTMAFKLAPFTDKEALDIPDMKPEFDGEKSPSKRLRNVLY